MSYVCILPDDAMGCFIVNRHNNMLNEQEKWNLFYGRDGKNNREMLIHYKKADLNHVRTDNSATQNVCIVRFSKF